MLYLDILALLQRHQPVQSLCRRLGQLQDISREWLTLHRMGSIRDGDVQDGHESTRCTVDKPPTALTCTVLKRFWKVWLTIVVVVSIMHRSRTQFSVGSEPLPSACIACPTFSYPCSKQEMLDMRRLPCLYTIKCTGTCLSHIVLPLYCLTVCTSNFPAFILVCCAPYIMTVGSCQGAYVGEIGMFMSLTYM